MALEMHNHARHEARGGSRPDLIWDTKLSESAQTYALVLALNRQFIHDPKNRTEGENLYWSSSPDATYEEAVRAWVDEKKFYSGQALGVGPKPPKERQYGHYTQVVWPETRRVGMAKAVGFHGGGTYIVARYSPPGNIVGKSAWRSKPSCVIV